MAEEGKEITKDEIQAIFNDIVNGLEELYSQGITYRNMEPANIWLTQDKEWKLSGLEHCLIGDARRSVKDEVGSGNFIYRSPETDKGIYGTKSDLWSLGVILFELAFGSLPFGDPLRR